MNDAGTAVAKGNVASTFPLEPSTPRELGFHEPQLQRLRHLIAAHIVEGRYPGAQIALARHGRLALFKHSAAPPSGPGRRRPTIRSGCSSRIPR